MNVEKVNIEKLLQYAVKINIWDEEDFIPIFQRSPKGSYVCAWKEQNALNLKSSIYFIEGTDKVKVNPKELTKYHVKLNTGIENDFMPIFYLQKQGNLICQWDLEGDLTPKTEIYYDKGTK